MTIVPETRARKIAFYQLHLPFWAEDPASIGITPEAVATLSGLVADAQEAYRDHLQAQIAARTATANFHNKVRRMHAGVGGGAHLIQIIKAFAAATADPGVFSRAKIRPPASPRRPGSLPAPGSPYGFEVKLFQTGTLELTWKCDNPEGAVGTIYDISRRLDNQGPFTPLGVCGAEKSFRDDTLPAGTHHCEYEVTALRSTRRGQPARYAINLGGAQRPPGTQFSNRLAA